MYVGAVWCGDIKYEAGKSTYTVDCGGAVGGSVKIRQPYNYLTLCEVEVYGNPTDKKPLRNVAPGTLIFLI